MQWTSGENAGFTSGKPWFYVNPNYKEINAEAEERDENSILNFYRACLALRKATPALLYGEYREYKRLSGRIYMYTRAYEGERVLIVVSFSEKEVKYRLSRALRGGEAKLLLGSYRGGEKLCALRPYEAQIWKL